MAKPRKTTTRKKKKPVGAGGRRASVAPARRALPPGSADRGSSETPLARSDSEWAVMRIGHEEVVALIQENIGAEGFSQFDLDRARVPAGGGLHWDLQSGEGADAIRGFEGVVIHVQDARRYWEVPYGEGETGAPPDCFSDDGIHGNGAPADACGGLCERCEFSKFGSEIRKGQPTRAQACKQVKLLFVIRADELLPTVIVLPPTSLAQARRYFLRLVSRMLRPVQVVTLFELGPAQNAGGIKYARCQMQVVRKLDDDEVLAFEAMQAAMIPSLRRLRPAETDFDDPGGERSR